jgi:lipopolysaccharide transport system permease protein
MLMSQANSRGLSTPVCVEITPDSYRALDMRQLWHYRELLYFLTWREIAVRYKQTVAGVAWAILQPAMTMAVFSLVFNRLAHMPSEGVPYPLFVIVGLVPWNFLANAVTQSSSSLVGNTNLITKVYFPRILIPVSAVCTGLLDVLLSFGLLIAVMGWYGVAPGAKVLWLPAVFVVALITALGTGMWLSVLALRYRDVKFVIPFFVQIWLFLTPVAYSGNAVTGPWRYLYLLNPMVGVVDGFRWCLLGTNVPAPFAVLLSAATAAVTFITGAVYFSRTESTLADKV